ncbi:hypothetical protein PFISCL1PPCAC_8825, partial [Pristionchus fissidentatus]
WLRHEKIQAIFKSEFLQSFMIDDQLYVTSATIFQPWTLHSIDTQNFSIKEVAVTYHTDGTMHNFPVLVHNHCAYAWNHTRMIRGSAEAAGFHWSYVDTTGPSPGNSSSQVCYFTEGAAPKYGVLSADYEWTIEDSEYELRLFELDINTMEWTRRVVSMHEKALNMLNIYSGLGMSAHACRGNIHLNFINSGFGSGQHLVMDLSTLTLAVACQSAETQPYHKFFVANDELYKIGSSLHEGTMIFKYLEANDEWIKVHYSPSFVGYSAEHLELCIAGSRVFIVGALQGKVDTRRRQVSVLELDPTLFDHSMALLLRNDNNREVARRNLPPHMSSQIVRDSSGDSELNIVDPAALINAFSARWRNFVPSAEFREMINAIKEVNRYELEHPEIDFDDEGEE